MLLFTYITVITYNRKWYIMSNKTKFKAPVKITVQVEQAVKDHISQTGLSITDFVNRAVERELYQTTCANEFSALNEIQIYTETAQHPENHLYREKCDVLRKYLNKMALKEPYLCFSV